MKALFFILWAVFFLSPVGVAQDDRAAQASAAFATAPQAILSIKAEDLARHYQKLASPAYEGRLTATPGQRAAARYIAKHFEQCGLLPLGDLMESGARSYFQRWPITLQRTAPGTGFYDAAGAPLHRHGAWILGRQRGEDKTRIAGPMMLVPEKRLQDIESIEGKLPIVTLSLRDDPENVDIYKAFQEGLGHQAGYFRRIATALARRGAEGGVVVLRDMNVSFLSTSNTSFLAPGKPLVSQGHAAPGEGRDLPRGLQQRIPLLILSADDVPNLWRSFDTTIDAAFAEDASVQYSEDEAILQLQVESVQTYAQNVVALWPGQEGASEAIVYSAHMDHVGLAANGSAFQGADDNGSGTSTLLELAEAFAAVEAADRPKRSVIFLSVSGEENGLWGSEWYSEHPTWPADQIIANLNVDMIGRNTTKVPRTKISITPTHKHAAYSSLAADAAFLGRAVDLALADGDRFYERSDHYNFARLGIPVVFLCDDEHVDYHMPTDTPDKLDGEKMERVGRLLWLLGWRTLTAEGRPKVLGPREDW